MEQSEPSCKEKLAFDNKEQAEGAAVYIKHLHGTRLKTYKCKNCTLWHLATDNKKPN